MKTQNFLLDRNEVDLLMEQKEEGKKIDENGNWKKMR